MAKFSSRNCSIGIVTYLGRFETYFKPLVKKLHWVFPDYDINVFINGHYDTARQIQYLKDVTCFLQKYPNIRYVTNLEHQSLARGWNWLILMAQCERVMVLNDDVSFNCELRHNFEGILQFPEICTLNGSWSHFIISKSMIKKLGWFDERFLGIGDEDYDYIFRLALKGIPLGNISIQGLHNHMAPPTEASWANISGIVHGKYSTINRDFLRKKWLISEHQSASNNYSMKVMCHYEEWEIGINENIEEAPEYYPKEVLNYKNIDKIENNYIIVILTSFAKICSFVNFIYWAARRGLGIFLRGLLGRRWDRLRGRKAV